MMSSVSAAAAARETGLSDSDLATLESTGKPPKQLDYLKLAELIGLDAGKLSGIAAGWLPAATDLCRWRELRCVTTSDGEMAVNAYLAWDEVTREAALFDTGWDAVPVFQEIEKHGLQLKHLFITHSHEDHIAAVDAVRARFPKVRLHCSTADAPVDQRNRPNDFIHLAACASPTAILPDTPRTAQLTSLEHGPRTHRRWPLWGMPFLPGRWGAEINRGRSRERKCGSRSCPSLRKH